MDSTGSYEYLKAQTVSTKISTYHVLFKGIVLVKFKCDNLYINAAFDQVRNKNKFVLSLDQFIALCLSTKFSPPVFWPSTYGWESAWKH